MRIQLEGRTWNTMFMHQDDAERAACALSEVTASRDITWHVAKHSEDAWIVFPDNLGDTDPMLVFVAF